MLMLGDTNLIQFNDMRMIETLHDFNLAVDFL